VKKAVLPVMALVIALAGCNGSGGNSERERIRGIVQQYFEATADGDGRTGCSSLTQHARRGFSAVLAVPPSRNCEANIRKVARRSLPLRAIRVSEVVTVGERATAQVDSARPPYSTSVTLARQGGSWKLLYLPVAIHRFQFPRLHAHGHH
jgi:hypothetical protein